MTSQQYDFTNNWFDATTRSTWEVILKKCDPQSILEIGSYEGASVCWMIDNLSQRHALQICCVDTWEGGIEHQRGGLFAAGMTDVESRFKKNLAVALKSAKHPVQVTVEKTQSHLACAKLMAERGEGIFDFIYIDGSHQAPDVLADAVLCFKLLKVGGMMAFDDYLWGETPPDGRDPLRCPKIAIDAFININIRKINVLPLPANQIYLVKISD